MRRWVLALAALSGGLAVMAGAYGAHGAHGSAAELLRMGAQYQMVHAVAAIALGRERAQRLAPPLLLAGAALFAGSLYLLAFGAPRWLGIATPVGGLLLIVGWIAAALGAFRAPTSLETRS